MNITPIGLNHHFFYQNELPNTFEEGWYTLTNEEKPVSIKHEVNALDQQEPRFEQRSLEIKSQNLELVLPCLGPEGIICAFCAECNMKSVKIIGKRKEYEEESDFRKKIILSLNENKITTRSEALFWRTLNELATGLKRKLTLGPIICMVEINKKQDWVIIFSISQKLDRIFLKNSNRQGFDCTIEKIAEYFSSSKLSRGRSMTVVQIDLKRI